MLVKVGELTFGWGADVRFLPENKDAYGPKSLGPDEEIALAAAIRQAGWVPSWRVKPSERVVFFCDGNAKWRQSVTTKASGGQTLQVVEAPATPPAAPKKGPKKGPKK